MKHLLKPAIILVLGMIVLYLQSCDRPNQVDNTLFGFRFGQTQMEVDSVASNRGFRKLAWVNSTGYEGRLDTLGVRWMQIEARFEKDSLCSIALLAHKDSEDDGRVFESKINDVLENHFHVFGKRLEQEPYEEYGAWIFGNYVVSFIPKGEYFAVLQICPYSEDNAKTARLEYIDYKIDENLKKLANAMAGYIKARESGQSTMREVYADDVRSANGFLNKHYDLMTPRQKELFDKLRNITY